MSTPLSPDLLLKAYAIGVFPMAEGRADPRIVWLDTDAPDLLGRALAVLDQAPASRADPLE